MIERRIYLIRGHKVMLDTDLADLYQVPTKVFNQAVKRNKARFPEDFMFQLSKSELENWRSQIVTSNPAAKMALRRPPYAFTEQGVAMLSAVLPARQYNSGGGYSTFSGLAKSVVICFGKRQTAEPALSVKYRLESDAFSVSPSAHKA
jgi:hypothetical protein